MREVIFAVLMGLPPWHGDAKEDGREARMEVVASAIDAAASRAVCDGAGDDCERVWPLGKAELAAMLVTLGWWESRYARHVQLGKCGRAECDPVRLRGGRVVHRARSYWQIQASFAVPVGEWRGIAGDDGLATTERAAWAAARVVARSYGRCRARGARHGWEVGVVSGYAGATTCGWSGAGRRVAFYRRILAKLR